MYIPDHFDIKELTPPEMGTFIQKHGEAFAWAVLFDDRLLMTLDMLRSQFGSLVANNWASGKNCKYRGFRPPGCGVGAKYSQHRYGRAADLIPLDTAVWEIRKEILKHPDSPRYQYIGAVEMNVHWLHIDVRGRVYPDKIMEVYP
jgi:hypothetical protein